MRSRSLLSAVVAVGLCAQAVLSFAYAKRRAVVGGGSSAALSVFASRQSSAAAFAPGGPSPSAGSAAPMAADKTPVASAAPVAPFIAPAGTQLLPHVVKANESLGGIVSHYLPESIYMRRSELEDAVRQANGLTSGRLKPGMEIKIPGIPEKPILDKPQPIPSDFVARGIYLTAYTAGSSSGLELIKRWKEAGGNTVVFDIKDYDGLVHTPFLHAYAPDKEITIRNLPKFIHFLHSLDLHAVARIAVFRDEYLVPNHPELAVQSKATGKAWRENGKLVWTDPSNPVVQQYNLDLARLAAQSGADEVQFDYVRFPAEGNQADAQFAYQKDHPDWPRSKVITDFVARAETMLHEHGSLFSIDVFGIMAWARAVDLNHTGQNIADLAKHVDVMCPMIYPSHFFGFDGYTVPGDAPEHFISESMQRFESATKGTNVTLRPWLQAFAWHTKSYSAEYILTQIRVSHQQGGVGFMFWNARNDYSKPFAAAPEMESAIHTLPTRAQAPATEPKVSPPTR